MNQCLIGQTGGIGDCGFLQSAVSYFARDFMVIHPVLPQILETVKRINSKAEFISSDDTRLGGSVLLSEINLPAKIGNDIYIPFEKASQTIPGCVIRAKYKLVGLSVEGWQESFSFRRDLGKEKKLEDLLELPPEFNFINRNFATPPNIHRKWEVQPKNDLPVVEMRFLKGFDLFDYCGILEKATGIYTVDTSLLLVAEKLDLRAEKLEMWARWNNYESITGLFEKPWNYN